MASADRELERLREALTSDACRDASILAPRARARPSRALKHNDTFAVMDAHGDINAASDGTDGLFHCDTRHLSYLELTMLGFELLLLGSSMGADETYLCVDLTNPDITREGRLYLAKDQLHIVRTTYLDGSGLHHQVGITNYGDDPVDVVLNLGFDSDFADLFELRGMSRKSKGTVRRNVCGPGEVRFNYRGLDRIVRITRIRFAPEPDLLHATVARYNLTLQPRKRAYFSIAVESTQQEVAETKQSFLTGLINARLRRRRRMREQALVETGNPMVNEMLRRSAAALAMLMTDTPQGPYPYAGLPWYAAVFGRDGIITAMELLWLNPDLARSVLRFLAAHQATATDPQADAEPGKILHEAREGEMAALREVPFGLYYGSVDATPLFVVLAGLYAERTGDDELVAELWENIEAALAWMEGPGDPDKDGFIEYARKSTSGLVNQGWKDSHDSVFHADGSLAQGPIALVEVQAYAYEARKLAAGAARRLGKTVRAEQLDRAAERLRARFERAFWSDELGSYVLALDGEKRQCAVRSSNAGQVLRSGIASSERAAKVADLMLSPSFQSGWGIRTIADTEARYNPMSYHNGSIWPHDNALITAGLSMCGRQDGTERVTRSLYEAGIGMDQRKLPELFCGFQRRRGRAPILYPVACSPQAWSSAAVFYLLQSLLGLQIDGRGGLLRFTQPVIPDWLGYVRLRGVKVGRSTLDLRLVRDPARGKALLEVLHNDGNLPVELC
jgi:glycogen debranching enzyme